MPAKTSDYNFLRPRATASTEPPAQPKPLTMTDFQFLNRMDEDTDARRKNAFINTLKKDPRFKPSMLEPPKPKFKTVSLDGGPIVKSHKAGKTGFETRRPHQWGPLGGWW